jgi:hypothetical protein
MYNQIDVTLQNKLRNLSKMPKYADQLYDELTSIWLYIQLATKRDQYFHLPNEVCDL